MQPPKPKTLQLFPSFVLKLMFSSVTELEAKYTVVQWNTPNQVSTPAISQFNPNNRKTSRSFSSENFYPKLALLNAVGYQRLQKCRQCSQFCSGYIKCIESVH